MTIRIHLIQRDRDVSGSETDTMLLSMVGNNEDYDQLFDEYQSALPQATAARARSEAPLSTTHRPMPPWKHTAAPRVSLQINLDDEERALTRAHPLSHPRMRLQITKSEPTPNPIRSEQRKASCMRGDKAQ